MGDLRQALGIQAREWVCPHILVRHPPERSAIHPIARSFHESLPDGPVLPVAEALRPFFLQAVAEGDEMAVPVLGEAEVALQVAILLKDDALRSPDLEEQGMLGV